MGEAAANLATVSPKGRPVTIRVVIAEDEAIIRMDLRETLEEEGYEVVGETGRGDTAVELVRELLPDLAILDIKMPGMDGLAAARIINQEKLCRRAIWCRRSRSRSDGSASCGR
jgi:DNA-binding NarL/FixJ family response regulator